MAVWVGNQRRLRAQAIQFLLDAYGDIATRDGKGMPHAQAVADILRDSGADDATQIAGLLHDVVEDTPRTVEDVRAAFGDEVAAIVDAVTEDDSIDRYAARKRLLRSRIAAAGGPAVEISLADKIASLRYSLLTGTKIRKRKLAHYRASLDIALAAGVGGDLSSELAGLLAGFS